MKNRFFIFVMMAFIGLGVQNAAAQDFKGPKKGDMAKMETEGLKKALSLTDDQTTKVQAINEKYSKKMDEMHADKTQTKEAAKTKMDEMRKQKDEEIKAVLTADQVKKYEEQKAKMKDKKPQDMLKKDKAKKE